MIIEKRVLFLALLLFVFGSSFVLPGHHVGADEKKQDGPTLYDELMGERTSQVAGRLLAQRSDVIRQALEALRQYVKRSLGPRGKTLDYRAFEVIYVLEFCRAEEAVPDLCELVMVLPLANELHANPYPAQRALVAIGKPSVEHILKIMPDEQDRDRLRAYGEVLRRIEGDKRARELVGILAQRAATPNKKKLMNLVVEHIEKRSRRSPVPGLLEKAEPQKQ